MTSRFWPMRCARAWACRSAWGFQSESKRMTVSAVARLMPRPPARVESRKTKRSSGRVLKRSIRACRSCPATLPSILQLPQPRSVHHSSRMSRVVVNWLKSTTRCPRALRRGSMSFSSASLPEASTICLRRVCLSVASRPGSAPSNSQGWLQHLRSSITMLTILAGLSRFEPSVPARVGKWRARICSGFEKAGPRHWRRTSKQGRNGGRCRGKGKAGAGCKGGPDRGCLPRLLVEAPLLVAHVDPDQHLLLGRQLLEHLLLHAAQHVGGQDLVQAADLRLLRNVTELVQVPVAWKWRQAEGRGNNGRGGFRAHGRQHTPPGPAKARECAMHASLPETNRGGRKGTGAGCQDPWLTSRGRRTSCRPGSAAG